MQYIVSMNRTGSPDIAAKKIVIGRPIKPHSSTKSKYHTNPFGINVEDSIAAENILISNSKSLFIILLEKPKHIHLCTYVFSGRTINNADPGIPHFRSITRPALRSSLSPTTFIPHFGRNV